MKNIVLIGFMGSGKTTIATSLAEQKKVQMVDTDAYIEEQEEQKITEIFAARGEAYFRKRETENIKGLIRQYQDAENVVFSTGGGLPVKEENRSLLRELGTVVFLKISAETVYQRLQGDTTRPLLQCENPMERIQNMLTQRNPIYEDAADVVISVDGKTEAQIVDELMIKLEEVAYR